MILFYRFNATLLSSRIGDFNVKLLQQSVNLLINGFVVPILNGQLYHDLCSSVPYIFIFILSFLLEYVNAGLVIPTVDGVSFVNPQVTLGQVCTFQILLIYTQLYVC